MMAIHMESEDMNRKIKELLDRVERPRKLLNVAARLFHAFTMKMFRGRRPDTSGVRGVKWPHLAKSTIASKKNLKKHGKLAPGVSPFRPMVMFAKLRDHLKIQSKGAKGFTYGTNVKSKEGFDYPAHHNFGKFLFLFIGGLYHAQMIKATLDYLSGVLKTHSQYKKEV